MERLLFTVLFIFLSLSNNFNITGFATEYRNLLFSISSITVESTETQVTVITSVLENPGFASADITIKTELKILAIDSDVFDVFANPENGKVNWSRTNNDYRTGEVLKIVLELPVNAKVGDIWNVDILVNRIVDENVKDVPTEITAGGVQIVAVSNSSQPKTFWEKMIVFFQKVIDFLVAVYQWITEGVT